MLSEQSNLPHKALDESKIPLWVIFICTIAGVYVSYLIRDNWTFLYQHCKTYPSDIWYIYNNYGYFLVNQNFFVLEYPAPMLTFFKVLSYFCCFFPLDTPTKYGSCIYSYNVWLIANSIVLGIAALASVWFLYKLNQNYFKLPCKKILLWFVLTPTFIFFTLYNYDIIPIMCCLYALIKLLEKDYVSCFIVLSIGSAFKTYPLAIAFLYFLCIPKKEQFKAFICTIVPLLLLNVPYMLQDMDKWMFPYVWQMNFDNTAQSGRFLYTLTGYTGKLPALCTVVGVLLFACWKIYLKMPPEPLKDPSWLSKSSLVVIIAFVFCKNVFSPQYILWMLPYITLSTAFPFWGIGTLLEVINVSEGFFIDYWRNGHEEYLTAIRLIREIGIVILFVSLVKSLVKPGKDK